VANYINNKDLHAELVVSIAQGKLTKRCQEMLYLIGHRLHRKMIYKNDDDRNDTYQEGMYHIFYKWMMYDPDRFDNAFAYISEIYKRGMAQGWNKIKERNPRTGFQPTKTTYYYNDDDGAENVFI
jgi:hypothetical protein